MGLVNFEYEAPTVNVNHIFTDVITAAKDAYVKSQQKEKQIVQQVRESGSDFMEWVKDHGMEISIGIGIVGLFLMFRKR